MASVPAAHPYVRRLGAPVTLLADPQPPGAPAGQWWPPVMLGAGWVAANRGSFDLLHLHFGAESFSVAELEAFVAALRAAGRPLVHTVHDLEHPQLADQAHHEAQLDVLIPAADALITLTPGAAAEIDARWGRRATVIPHARMRNADSPLPITTAARGPRTIGLHLRDLRPNVDAIGATRTLLRAVTVLRAGGHDVVARVELHAHTRDPDTRAAVLRLCGEHEAATAVVGPRPGDRALERGLAGMDAVVLPYRHGTHSGWLELCWDLGVPVAVPAIGHLAEQQGDPAFAAGDATSLAEALREILARPEHPGSEARTTLQHARRAQRDADAGWIADAHAAVYGRVLSRCA